MSHCLTNHPATPQRPSDDLPRTVQCRECKLTPTLSVDRDLRVAPHHISTTTRRYHETQSATRRGKYHELMTCALSLSHQHVAATSLHILRSVCSKHEVLWHGVPSDLARVSCGSCRNGHQRYCLALQVCKSRWWARHHSWSLHQAVERLMGRWLGLRRSCYEIEQYWHERHVMYRAIIDGCAFSIERNQCFILESVQQLHSGA